MKITLKKLALVVFFAFIGITGLLTITVNSISVAKDAYVSIRDKSSEKIGINKFLKGITGGIENGFSSNLFAQNKFINLYGMVERVLDRQYIIDVDSSYNLTKDNMGKLQFSSFKENNQSAVDQIVSINSTLEENNINFLYVQTPIKYLKGFTRINPAITDYSNENSDKIVDALQKSGVHTIDLRNLIDNDIIDKSNLFYNTDHHWRIETAFWSVGKTVEKIKYLFDIDLDSTGFYTNLDNYKMNYYEKSFLGSQGRRVGKYYAGVDDFTLVTPKFKTDYNVTINNKNTTEKFYGDFNEAIINQDILQDKNIFTNRYVSYFGADYPEIIIENLSSEKDLKILIVKDSFGIPFSAFMSLMVSETRMLDMRYYKDKSVEEYALQYKPDLVLYVFRNIRTIE